MYTASMLGYPPPKITAMKDDKVRERRGREGGEKERDLDKVGANEMKYHPLV